MLGESHRGFQRYQKTASRRAQAQGASGRGSHLLSSLVEGAMAAATSADSALSSRRRRAVVVNAEQGHVGSGVDVWRPTRAGQPAPVAAKVADRHLRTQSSNAQPPPPSPTRIARRHPCRHRCWTSGTLRLPRPSTPPSERTRSSPSALSCCCSVCRLAGCAWWS